MPNLKGVTITFERDIPEADADNLVRAIQIVVGQFRNVASVTALTSNLEDDMARERVRFEIRSEIQSVLRGDKTGR